MWAKIEFARREQKPVTGFIIESGDPVVCTHVYEDEEVKEKFISFNYQYIFSIEIIPPDEAPPKPMSEK